MYVSDNLCEEASPIVHISVVCVTTVTVAFDTSGQEV